MLKERFAAHFNPGAFTMKEQLLAKSQYFLACLLFNTFPFAQQTRDVRSTLRYVGHLASKGFCPVIFPEGERTSDGKLLPLKEGTALLSIQLEIPVVPIYLKGLFEIMPLHANWPKSGSIEVNLGEPLSFSAHTSPVEATRTLAQALRRLARDHT